MGLALDLPEGTEDLVQEVGAQQLEEQVVVASTLEEATVHRTLVMIREAVVEVPDWEAPFSFKVAAT